MSLDIILKSGSVATGTRDTVQRMQLPDFILHEELWSRKEFSLQSATGAKPSSVIRPGDFLDKDLKVVDLSTSAKITANAKSILYIAIEAHDPSTGFGAAGLTSQYGDHAFCVLAKDAIIKDTILKNVTSVAKDLKTISDALLSLGFDVVPCNQ